MCGITGFTGMHPAAPVLLNGLSRLEYRGYDSAGIAVLNGNAIHIEKVSGRIAKLYEKTEGGKTVPGTIGIGHTRQRDICIHDSCLIAVSCCCKCAESSYH